MPRAWNLVGHDDRVNFYFRNEHHLLMVLEGALYTFRGWMVAIDRWNNRDYPTYLWKIPFWIHINQLPNQFRRKDIVESIGSRLGHFHSEGVQILEPPNTKPTQVWVHVDFVFDEKISLVQMVRVMSSEPPMKLQFRYDVLRTTCGSLRHAAEDCDTKLTKMQQEEQLMQLSEASINIGMDFNTDTFAQFLGSSSKQGINEASTSQEGNKFQAVPIPVPEDDKKAKG